MWNVVNSLIKVRYVLLNFDMCANIWVPSDENCWWSFWLDAADMALLSVEAKVDMTPC
jgi:hypothetical protein